MTMTNCTLSDNSASYGGAIYNEFGTMTVSNWTVSGNSTTFGVGRIENGGFTGIRDDDAKQQHSQRQFGIELQTASASKTTGR